MRNILSNSIRPVVHQNFVVIWISEGNGTTAVKYWASLRRRLRQRIPEKALTANEICDGRELGLCVVCPGNIPAEIRWLTFQDPEIIFRCQA